MVTRNRTAVLVGRPNVGKSALFNRLVGRRISIVHDQPGVTRDRIMGECRGASPSFSVVDTGGIGEPNPDGFEEDILLGAEVALASAGVILLVLDGQTGLTPSDQVLADSLRKTSLPVIPVVNKADLPRHETFVSDFTGIGFGEPLAVSAEHGRGIEDLIDRVQALLPPVEDADSTAARPLAVALVGRPNTGKSSLVNAILKTPRTLVSPVAGTTRDAVDVPFSYGETPYVLIDTAGIRPRKQSQSSSSVEVFSVMRAERSIRRADLCILVIDLAAGVTAQDKKIAGRIQEAGKPCLLALNKLDLLEPGRDRKDFYREARERVQAELFFLSHAPTVFVSAKTGDQVERLFTTVERIRHGSRKRLGTGALNRILQRAMETHPPPSRTGRRFKLLYATQGGNPEDPIPAATFILFVNEPGLLPATYHRYLEAALRREVPFEGLPVQFRMRGRQKKE